MWEFPLFRDLVCTNVLKSSLIGFCYSSSLWLSFFSNLWEKFADFSCPQGHRGLRLPDLTQMYCQRGFYLIWATFLYIYWLCLLPPHFHYLFEWLQFRWDLKWQIEFNKMIWNLSLSCSTFLLAILSLLRSVLLNLL